MSFNLINILEEIWNEHKCTGNHISFYVFVLYRVKSGNVFTACSRPTASNTKSPHKSQIVTSSNGHVIRASVWSLVRQFSHRRAAVHATWSIASPMTCWCRPNEIMQQSGAAEVRILVENSYKFKVFGGIKFVNFLIKVGMSKIQ